MSGPDKKVPIGRVKSDDARMVYRTQFTTVGELIQRLAPAIYDWGLLVRDTSDHEDGTFLQFAILLADGTPAVRARAKVKKSNKLPPGRMALKFTALDPNSEAVWRRMVEIKTGGAAPAEQEPAKPAPQPQSAPTPIPPAPQSVPTPIPPAPQTAPTPIPPAPQAAPTQIPPAPQAAPAPIPQAPQASPFSQPPAVDTASDPERVMQAPAAHAPAGDSGEIQLDQIPKSLGDEAAVASSAVKQDPGVHHNLDDSLRRMVLIDEDAGLEAIMEPQVVAEPHEGPVLGVDLGTTNSCCSIVKGDRPFVIPSRRGHNTIPSVVAINAMGEELVGHAAKAQMEINPERTIYGSKRLVGRPFDSPIVKQVCDRFHYKIVEGPNNQAAVLIDDRILSLEEVASMILTEIKDTAQEYLGRYVERAVITVPAFYNENQRAAVRKAGEMAGFYVERILNEPTAAALTFGAKNTSDRRLLVYDLGGGTFDATLMELKGGTYEVLSTGGDTFLGGVDFDTQLMDHILIEFQLDLGKMPDMDRVAYLRVLQGAEFAKRTLSGKSEAQVRLPFIGRLEGKPVDLDVTVDRNTLEQLVGPMVQRTLDVCESVMAQRSMKPEDVDDILLVGGQTRMPMIWAKIQELFGKEPLKGVHPDESVATGAALMGHSIDQDASFKLVDVLPMSIGVGVPGGVFRKVITAGTALPAARTYGLYTYVDNQTNMVIPVYQGESNNIDESELLGIVELAGIPPGKAGSRMLEITFGLTQECLLTVTARDRDGEKLAEVSLSARDSVESLMAKLRSVPERAALAAEVRTERETSPEMAALSPDGASPAKKKGGFFGWLKRLFGKKS